jgi:hypothetical protein
LCVTTGISLTVSVNDGFEPKIKINKIISMNLRKKNLILEYNVHVDSRTVLIVSFRQLCVLLVSLNVSPLNFCCQSLLLSPFHVSCSFYVD